MEIRLAQPQDLDQLLHLDIADGPSHDGCLQRQATGRGKYLVAWDAHMPVGRLYLRWRNTEAPRLLQEHAQAHDLIALPELCDIYVAPNRRSQGVGTHLIHAALEQARVRGLPSVTICVDTDNPRAQALYERLGFVESGIGVFTTRGTFTTEDGTEEPWQNGPQMLLIQALQ
jgi:GNAT superfamily N-acetyltransferase